MQSRKLGKLVSIRTRDHRLTGGAIAAAVTVYIAAFVAATIVVVTVILVVSATMTDAELLLELERGETN